MPAKARKEYLYYENTCRKAQFLSAYGYNISQ